MRKRELAGKAHGWFRTWFGKVWKVRGGGLYACGYAITFVILEIQTIFGDIAEADGPVDFVQNQAFEMVFRFLGESLQNMIFAFMWPVPVVQFNPPAGAIALGIAYFLFPMTLKKPIERWLFPDMEETLHAGAENEARKHK
ncbi:MAG: hypothetical protein GWN47_02080 [Woeseiaceae bacterium]|nr:hypothetical protein [Woeseiaceae bacterium]